MSAKNNICKMEHEQFIVKILAVRRVEQSARW